MTTLTVPTRSRGRTSRLRQGMLQRLGRFPQARNTMSERRAEVTRILRAPSGPRDEQLLPLVYEELRTIASNRMGGERSDHTLQATALVHEAYMRLVGQEAVDWRDRRHFYGAAGEAMRRILIDHARKSKSQKRGGDHKQVTLGGQEAPVDLAPEQLLEVDDAFDRLAAEDAQAAEVTRLRFFAGLSVEETSEALGISVRGVHRKWTYARARLFELLEEE